MIKPFFTLCTNQRKISFLETSYLIICALLLLSPVVYSTNIAMGVMSSKFFFIFFLTCASILVAIIQLIKKTKAKDIITYNRVDIVMSLVFFYLVWNAWLVSQHANIISGQGEKVITFICAITLYFSLRVFGLRDIFRKHFFEVLKMTFIGVVFFECLFVCLQKFDVIPSLSEDYRIKVTGTFIHPAMLGGLLALIIPFFYSQLNIKWHEIKDITVPKLALLAGLITLLFSESRAALLATLVAVAYCELTKNEKVIHYLRKNKKVLVISIAGFLILFIGMISIRTSSVFGRVLVWKICWPMIKDAPITGHGIGSFSDLYPAYQMQYFLNSTNNSEKHLADFVLYVYNEFLQIWIELGVVGLVLFILMVIFCLFSKSFNREEWGAKAAILAFTVFSFFSYPFSLNYMTLYFFLFLGIANIYSFNVAIKGGMLFSVVIVVAITSPVFFIQSVYKKLLAYRQLTIAEEKPDTPSISKAYGEQYNVLWNDNIYLSKYAQSLEKSNNQKLGLSVLLKKRGLTYNDYLLIGDMYSNNEKSDSAILYYEKAKLLLPNSNQPVQRILREKAIKERFQQ